MSRGLKDLRRPRSGNRAGSEVQFPGKLHDMMAFVEREGLESIISWVQNGRAVMVHKPDKLVELLPIFFSQTKYRSFERQLNMWHFERVLDGPNKGAFIHPYFIQGNKPLCAYMSRHGICIPSQKSDDQDQIKSSLKEKIANMEVSAEKTPSCDFLDSLTSLPDLVSSDEDSARTGSDLKDGDLSMFEGRHFYFVDPVVFDSNKKLQREQQKDLLKKASCDFESVFRDLRERKRNLLQQSQYLSGEQKLFETGNLISREASFVTLQNIEDCFL